MPKFTLASDLHLDVTLHSALSGFTIPNTTDSDTLVIAGDATDLAFLVPGMGYEPVHQASRQALLHFLDAAGREYEHVIYVLGNHEHWHAGLYEAPGKLRSFILRNLPHKNIRVLQNDTFVIGNTAFHGGTMWTNVGNNNPVIAEALRVGMARDYGSIPVGTRTMIPSDGISEFNITLNYFKRAIKLATEAGQDSVVISHHHPTMAGIQSEYVSDLVSHGYASDISDFILDHPEIRYWCCGHIHERVEYQIGSTTVTANPRGYLGYESLPVKFQPVTYEYR